MRASISSAFTSSPSPRHITESVSSSRKASAWLISLRFCRSAMSSSLASAAAARSAESTANLYSPSASFSWPSASASRPRNTETAGFCSGGMPMTSRSLLRFAAPE